MNSGGTDPQPTAAPTDRPWKLALGERPPEGCCLSLASIFGALSDVWGLGSLALTVSVEYSQQRPEQVRLWPDRIPSRPWGWDLHRCGLGLG